MPLIGKIHEEALSTLTEAELVASEQGPVYVRELVTKLTMTAEKMDKSELAHMSTYDIFLTILYITNSNNFTYEETVKYCEEIKKAVNAWTFDKDHKRLDICDSKTNEDGSLKDWTCVNTMKELGLTPVFVNYSMKLVYVAMYHFLKLKKDILTNADYVRKLSIPQRMQWMKGVYERNNFSVFVRLAKEILEDLERDHSIRQKVATSRIKVTTELIDAIGKDKLEEMIEIPIEWHQYLDPSVLEPLYELIHQNIVSKKISLDKEEQSLLQKRNKSVVTTYLYDNNLDPYSLPEEKLTKLESIPNIIEKLEFMKFLGISINNTLTIYYDYLVSITEEQISSLRFLISSNVLTKKTLKDNINIIGRDYQRILDNYEILKNIIDFNNRFYSDKILLKDLREIKEMLSVLKEYKLSTNNYIFLLCNYEYLYLYDLLIEKDIPEDLFISICNTENPLNTIKRILIFIGIGEPYTTINNILKKDVTSESKFICYDDSLDEYIPNVVEENGLNIVKGTTIQDITDNETVQMLDREYRVENTYIIGGTIISRPKFLRNFESVQGDPSFLIFSLVSNSILNDKEYYDLTNELRKNKAKK